MSKSEFTILLIDDNIEWALTIKRFLEGPDARSYLSRTVQVAVETDGRQAMERYKSIEPDILLLDIDLGLKEVTGLQLCAKFAMTPRYQKRQLGIVVMSAVYVNLDDEIAGMRQGAHHYVAVDAGFHLSILAGRLNALLNLIEPDTQTLDVDEHLTIDFATESVLVQGKRCQLAPAEYAILAFLAQPPGKVQTRYDIQKHAHVEAISKIMVSLKDKITPQGLERDHYIKSVRGVGYMLDTHG